ncbi:MAG: DUF4179 domain-containing protein [Oscillospiraceae bacterium]|nr:DUF4179 domain-containing protein [Oscillospiraceae bacterium]
MRHDPITELDEQRLDELMEYLPSYTGQNAENIQTLFRQKTAEGAARVTQKSKRRLKPLWRRALLAASLTLVFLTGMTAANATVDLSWLYEPILGERASQYLQGINKTSSSEGITLTVDAAYSDGEMSMVFLTLTDTEGKGRIKDGLLGDFNYNTWLYNAFRIGGSWGQSWGMTEIAPDGNSGHGYISMSSDDSLSGRLMTLETTAIRSGLYLMEHEIELDILAYLAENPEPETRIWFEGMDNEEIGLAEGDLDVPLPITHARIVNMGFVDGVFNVMTKGEQASTHLILTDGVTDFDYNGYSEKDEGNLYLFHEITLPEQLEGLRLLQREVKYEQEIYGNWNVSFRLEETAERQVYTLNAVLPDGATLETVTVTPVSVTFRGAGDGYSMLWIELDEKWWDEKSSVLVTASGQPAIITGTSASSNGSRYYYRLIGIIPDDVIAIRIGGVEYPLE